MKLLMVTDTMSYVELQIAGIWNIFGENGDILASLRNYALCRIYRIILQCQLRQTNLGESILQQSNVTNKV